MYDVKGLPSIVTSTRRPDSFTVTWTRSAGRHRADIESAAQRRIAQRIGCPAFTLAVKFYHMSTHFTLAILGTVITVGVAVALTPVSAQKPAEGKQKNAVEPRRVEKGGWIQLFDGKSLN